MSRSRRWIAQEIERLDPEVDYEAIWRLTSTYGLDDFAVNLVYAHLFPHFVIPMHGSETVYRGGDGKVVERATQRVEDTFRHNLTWWTYGPSHERTQASVANINRLHAHYARKYPGNFADLDVSNTSYTLALVAGVDGQLLLHVAKKLSATAFRSSRRGCPRLRDAGGAACWPKEADELAALIGVPDQPGSAGGGERHERVVTSSARMWSAIAQPTIRRL